MQSENNASRNNLIAKFSAILSLTEIGLGSLLHGLRIPLSGQSLSLNQVFILNLADIQIKNAKSLLHISTIVSLLKTLSPAGKKLTPMLAISMQGFLFYIGVQVFGSNFFGRLIGSTLSCLWAFIQPLILYLLIFGENLIFMAQYFLDKIQKIFPATPDNILTILAIMVLIKIILAMIICSASHFLSHEIIEKYQVWLKSFQRVEKKNHRSQNPFYLAIKDTFNPLVIFTLSLSLIYFSTTHNELSQITWLLLRPIAVAYLIFLFIRIYPIKKHFVILKKKNKLVSNFIPVNK